MFELQDTFPNETKKPKKKKPVKKQWKIRLSRAKPTCKTHTELDLTPKLSTLLGVSKYISIENLLFRLKFFQLDLGTGAKGTTGKKSLKSFV